MAKKRTWHQAIQEVLAETSPEALNCREISDRILEQGLMEKVGKTPNMTVAAMINVSLKNEGERSLYKRIKPGYFALRLQDNLIEEPEELEGKDSYEIISSFGIFWRKDKVNWQKGCRLLGKQGKKAEPINFWEQKGIYLLYDIREIIYVGRVDEGQLGTRLLQHTEDRMAERWDRFSWFGLCPITPEGKLDKIPETYNTEKLISILEAVFIETLEPRQNRKKGDGLREAEYLQETDLYLIHG